MDVLSPGKALHRIRIARPSCAEELKNDGETHIKGTQYMET